jgi:hypothetical protein
MSTVPAAPGGGGTSVSETVGRDELGFRRTVCACSFCKAHCRHVPGTLVPSDLPRLCPAGQGVLAWAEVHLRALTDKPYPALVPARNGLGHCHWFFDGKCAVHAAAPFGCAFFDAHMAEDEIRRRAEAMAGAIREDAAGQGLYRRVWDHLCRRGLVARSGDRDAVLAEMEAIRRRGPGRLRRAATTGP